MNAAQILAAFLGATIIIAVIWNILRRGVPADRDEDTETTFWSGD